MTAADMRHAATALRNPYLCNFPNKVAMALADLLDEAARGVDARIEAERHVGIPEGTIRTAAEGRAETVANAVLCWLGHSPTALGETA